MELDPESVVREYAPFVWRVLRHCGAPPDQLEDLSQEVFLVVVRKLPSFEGRSALSSWLFGVCRNVARQALRNRLRRRESPSEAPPEIAVPERQSENLARRRAWACVHAALQRLPEPTRMVFVLFELERMEMAQVAAALDCVPSTAYSRLYAARDQVRAALERAGMIERDQDIAEVV